jgi:DNA polymerase-3 subunit delta'
VKYFEHITIQSKAIKKIKQSLTNYRLAHAYLFYGQEGCGKDAIALEVAKALNCHNNDSRPCNSCSSCKKISQFNHPDIKYIFPTSSSWSLNEIKDKLNLKAVNPYSKIDMSGHAIISIERIRELKNESKYAPYEADRKVYIISDADKMTRESSNSFLKLLEEPPENLFIILTTSFINSVLETIRSRCHMIYFPTLTYESALSVVKKYQNVDDETQKIIHIAQGNLKAIFQLLQQDVEEKRQMVYEYLRAVASGNVLNLIEIVDTITKQRDKNFLMDILNLLILWFKDALQLVYLGMDTEIINIDFKEEIKRFTQIYKTSNFENIINEIEKTLRKLHYNIYNPLLLTVLGIRIKNNLTRIKS